MIRSLCETSKRMKGWKYRILTSQQTVHEIAPTEGTWLRAIRQLPVIWITKNPYQLLKERPSYHGETECGHDRQRAQTPRDDPKRQGLARKNSSVQGSPRGYAAVRKLYESCKFKVVLSNLLTVPTAGKLHIHLACSRWHDVAVPDECNAQVYAVLRPWRYPNGLTLDVWKL